ncbi:MAG: hypothetical protein ACLSHU_05010 [Oscillospiraceae bacterium]
MPVVVGTLAGDDTVFFGHAGRTDAAGRLLRRDQESAGMSEDLAMKNDSCEIGSSPYAAFPLAHARLQRCFSLFLPWDPLVEAVILSCLLLVGQGCAVLGEGRLEQADKTERLLGIAYWIRRRMCCHLCRGG